MSVLTPNRSNRVKPSIFDTRTPIAVKNNEETVKINQTETKESYKVRFGKVYKNRTPLIESPDVILTPQPVSELLDTSLPAKRKFESLRYRFIAATGQKPHPYKETNGEDAFVMTSDLLGVADGVGGWSDFGIDAGEYSRKFLEKCKDFHLSQDKITGWLKPEDLISKSYSSLNSAPTENEIKGSTTCTLVSLNNSTLRAANLGDSGFILIRSVSVESSKENKTLSSEGEVEWRAVYRSKVQEHYFNCPRQIGTDTVDQPKDCDIYSVSYQPNDILVLATDGLFDNLTLKEILQIVNATYRNTTSSGENDNDNDEANLKDLARVLTEEAFLASVDLTRTTPFEIGANENDIDYKGGKMDDITVLVAKICEKNNYEPEEEPMPYKKVLNFDRLMTN